MTDPQHKASSPDGTTDQQHVMGALRAGLSVEITTPTGKEFEAMIDEGEIVIIDSTDGLTVSGDEARERLKKVLRAVQTEWELTKGVEL